MYRKDLPEYFHPLMEGLTDGLVLRECEELAAAVYKYRCVSSSGPTDQSACSHSVVLIAKKDGSTDFPLFTVRPTM